MNLEFKTILIISAHNESRNIAKVIDEVKHSVDFVCVIDDESSDATAQIATRKLFEDGYNFCVISHRLNTGQGGARSTGASFAIYGTADDENAIVYSTGGEEWVPSEDHILIFTDGDGQLDPREIPSFVEKFKKSNVDFVKGDRFSSPDLLRVMPKVRLFGNVFLSALTKFSSGYWDLSDSQCGYFAMKTKIAKRLDWSILRQGYGQINDIVIRLNELNAKVSSIPVQAIYGVGEISGIKIHKVALPIYMTCLRGFYRRILVKNTIWKTHPLAAFYLFGHILIFVSTVLSAGIFLNILKGFTAPPLTSIFVMVVFTIGLLSIFQGIALDLAENRRLFVDSDD